MKYGYKPINGICVNCIGCNRLELESFTRSI